MHKELTKEIDLHALLMALESIAASSNVAATIHTFKEHSDEAGWIAQQSDLAKFLEWLGNQAANLSRCANENILYERAEVIIVARAIVACVTLMIVNEYRPSELPKCYIYDLPKLSARLAPSLCLYANELVEYACEGKQ